jgi:hypothetical protein
METAGKIAYRKPFCNRVNYCALSRSTSGNSLTDTLNRIIYANPSGDNPPARSSGVTVEEAEQWQALVPLAPPDNADKHTAQTLGIFAGPGRDFLLTTAFQQNGTILHEVVLLPRKLL